ncbi:MAG: MarC family protein [Pseudomonadota bacterium]
MFDYDLFLDFSIALFAFVNPLYTVPIFLTLTQGFSREERRRTAGVSAFTMFCTFIITAIIGDQLLYILGVDIPSFKIAGGLIILGIAFKMLFVGQDDHEETTTSIENKYAAGVNKDIGVYPLTIPLLAGPGLFATAVVFGGRIVLPEDLITLMAVALLLILQFWLTMVFAVAASRFVTDTTIRIGTSILGILLAAISVELILIGISESFGVPVFED